VVVKKRSVIQTLFSTIETSVSTTTYAAIPYSRILLGKAVKFWESSNIARIGCQAKTTRKSRDS
jgi:hypothetical protein